mgnify:CR=1 FL=1
MRFEAVGIVPVGPSVRRLLDLLLICGALIGCDASAPAPISPADVPAAGSSARIDPDDDHTTPRPRQEAAVEPVRPGDWFQDVTPSTGVRFAYRNGQEGGRFHILESLGGGVAMLDFDRDGDLDLCFTGGGSISAADPIQVTGRPVGFYRNDGEWQFVDITTAVGLDQPTDYSHGCTAADYDGDGWTDLLICCYGSCRLYRNTGQGGFRDVTSQSGLACPGWNTMAAFADVDGDGWDDLYVVRYLDWAPSRDRVCRGNKGVRDICSPGLFPAAGDRLFRNLGNGRFEDITRQAGLRRDGKGLGVVATDIDGNGRVDFYVANDECDNHLYLNTGTLPFNEVGLAAGVATNEYGVHDGSMGVDLGDFDADGRPDLFVTNFEQEDNALYRQLERASFTQATVSSGLAGHSRPLVGFGTACADFDRDGWLDLFVANGHVFYHTGQSPYQQRPQLFRNRKGQRFENISTSAGSYFRGRHVGRGAAIGDLDNDGDLDMIVVHQNANASILRNQTPTQPYLRIQLVGRRGNHSAVGARLGVSFRGRSISRWIKSGAGYFSRFDPRVLLPIEDVQPVDVTVDWPGGKGPVTETFRGLHPGRTHTLREGEGESSDVR